MDLRLTVSCVLLALPLHLDAQDPRAAADLARSREGIAPFAWMVGQWEGEAAMRTGPGEPRRIRQREDIVFGASGTVIMIRGTGLDPASGATVFEAAGMVWFDLDAGRVRMRTHRDGRTVDADVEIRPDTIVWGFAVPGGRVRYTITHDRDIWHEIGEFLRDGVPPVPTLEMRLLRRP